MSDGCFRGETSSNASVLLTAPCRAQRRSPAGWRTWWRCTQLESETWRSWRAWTCTAGPPGATPKSSRSRPTCTPTRARSDLRCSHERYWSLSNRGGCMWYKEEMPSSLLHWPTAAPALAGCCGCRMQLLCGVHVVALSLNIWFSLIHFIHLLRFSFDTTELLAVAPSTPTKETNQEQQDIHTASFWHSQCLVCLILVCSFHKQHIYKGLKLGLPPVSDKDPGHFDHPPICW